jgi:hypothetical protein
MQLAVLGGSGLLSGGGLMRVAILGASIAGSLLLNGRKKPVGKLNDVRVSSSAYGRGIAKVWGTIRTTGNMFWATDFREEKYYMTQKGKEKTGSKGEMKAKKGKATPMYRYYANFAMGMCEGPIDEVLRVWADNNLIFNKYNPDDKDVVGPGFSQEDDDDTSKDSQRSKASKKGSGGQGGSFIFRVYKGTDDQLPDSFMERIQGQGNCPAYRDLAYLMFEDLALADFGNRIPTITAEVSMRTESKPMQLGFTNLDPPAEGWSREFTDPYIIDVRHNRIYIGAVLGNSRSIMRVYDMVSRKEIARWDWREKMGAGPIPWWIGGEIGWSLLGGSNDYADRLQIQGVTPEGLLIGYVMTGNLGTMFCITPDGRVQLAWGNQGNFTDTGAGNSHIHAQAGMFPLVGQDPDGNPRGTTVIYESFGKLHVFDSMMNRQKIIATNPSSYPGRKGNFIVGAPGTNHAFFFTNTDYNAAGQIKVFGGAMELPYNPDKLGEGTRVGAGNMFGTDPSEQHEDETSWRTFAAWPNPAGREGNILAISYFSYVVGANAVCMIAGAPGSPWVVKWDLVTGNLLWEEKLPDVILNLNGFTCPPQYNNTNYLNFYSTSGVFVKIDFANETVEFDSSPAGVQYPNNNHPRFYWSERDAMVTIAPSKVDEDYLAPVIIYQDRKIQYEVNIGDICQEVAESVGIPLEQIDTSQVENLEPIIGWMMEQPSEARQVIQDLADTFQFDAVETDYILKFISRGQDPVLTIPYDMLGTIDTDFDVENERVEETFQYTLELPARVTLSFYNAKKDYETGSQYFARPSQPLPVMSTKENLEITLPAAMTNGVAKSIAKRILYSAWSERHTVKWSLTRDYLYLDPADVVEISLGDGRVLETRITDMDVGANYLMDMQGVANYADSYKHSAVADPDDGVVKQPRNGRVEANAMIFNIPYLSDEHEDPRKVIAYYWGATCYNSGFNYGVMQSSYSGSGWRNEGYTTLDLIWGNVSGIVPPPANGWNMEDTETVLTLVPAFNFNDPNVVYTWTSVTDSDWPSEQNMVIIGEEVILFKEVDEQPDGSVLISRLIRGYRGSIDAAYQHNVGGERWALVLGGSVYMTTDPLDYLNKGQSFYIATGFSPFTVGGTTSALTKGTPERPLPVGDVRRSNAGSDTTIQWSRATRIGGALKDGTGSVPLSEQHEIYKVYILDDPYDPFTFDPDDDSTYLLESGELTNPTWTLTGSTLTTIGKSNTMDLHFVIYQMSDSVGYGLPHGLTLPYAIF